MQEHAERQGRSFDCQRRRQSGSKREVVGEWMAHEPEIKIQDFKKKVIGEMATFAFRR